MNKIQLSVDGITSTPLSIGFEGENDHTQVTFYWTSLFNKYPDAVATMVIKPPTGNTYPKTVTQEDNKVVWDVTASDTTIPGNGSYQLTFTDGEEIIKTYIGAYNVMESITGNGEAPTPVEDWVTEANAVLAEFESDIAKINDKQDAPAVAGTEGQVLGLDENLEPVWLDQSGGGGGTSNYNQLTNRPQINGITLSGNKTGADLGLIDAPLTPGTSGQVLTSDGQGGQSWQTPQGGGGAVDDVQINGTSIVNQGVANIPLATNSDPGVAKVNSNYGIQISNGSLLINRADGNTVKAGTESYKPLAPANTDWTVFYGLARAAGDSTQKSSSNAVGNYTEDAKSSISEMLNGAVSVSGTTPSITAKAGVRYVCGEVSTLTIVVPASGCIDVTFESGSTATVLTVTPPTGQTMKWANGFDPTALEANTTYEINIMDGCLGVAGSWT